MKIYIELLDDTKNEIKTINGGKKGKYGKDFEKFNLAQIMIDHYEYL